MCLCVRVCVSLVTFLVMSSMPCTFLMCSFSTDILGYLQQTTILWQQYYVLKKYWNSCYTYWWDYSWLLVFVYICMYIICVCMCSCVCVYGRVCAPVVTQPAGGGRRQSSVHASLVQHQSWLLWVPLRTFRTCELLLGWNIDEILKINTLLYYITWMLVYCNIRRCVLRCATRAALTLKLRSQWAHTNRDEPCFFMWRWK